MEVVRCSIGVSLRWGLKVAWGRGAGRKEVRGNFQTYRHICILMYIHTYIE